jgi:predicted nucleic acid-binding protein
LGVARLRTSLGRERRVALDTSIFIYHLEANPRYLGLADCVFSWLDSKTSSAVTSVNTMTELLVKPYRESDEESAAKCYTLLSTYPNLEWISPTLEIADLAAEIRAIHRLRTPDALQAATSLRAKATAFLTNDSVFERIPQLGALVLDRFL